MEINGKWKGYYEYGLGYILPYFGNRVELEMIVNVDSSGNITGSTTEVPSEFSVNVEASIKGFIDQDLISFIKTYPVLPSIADDGTIQLTEGTLEIQHTGFIDRENQAIYGDWLIEEKFINEEGYNDIEYLTGIWLLIRGT